MNELMKKHGFDEITINNGSELKEHLKNVYMVGQCVEIQYSEYQIIAIIMDNYDLMVIYDNYSGGGKIVNGVVQTWVYEIEKDELINHLDEPYYIRGV